MGLFIGVFVSLNKNREIYGVSLDWESVEIYQYKPRESVVGFNEPSYIKCSVLSGNRAKLYKGSILLLLVAF